MRDKQVFTIKDFLYKFHEFKAMTPDRTEWTPERLEKNPPRYYRLLELIALMKAFDLGVDLENDFERLGFLEKRKPEDFKLLNAAIKTYAAQKEYEKEQFHRQGNIIKPYQSRLIIQKFFQLSESMRNLRHFNSGVIEAGSVTFRFAIHKTQAFINGIDTTELEEIETILLSVIDPKYQTFSRAELIEQYGFPDVDMRAISIEWT